MKENNYPQDPVDQDLRAVKILALFFLALFFVVVQVKGYEIVGDTPNEQIFADFCNSQYNTSSELDDCMSAFISLQSVIYVNTTQEIDEDFLQNFVEDFFDDELKDYIDQNLELRYLVRQLNSSDNVDDCDDFCQLDKQFQLQQKAFENEQKLAQLKEQRCLLYPSLSICDDVKSQSTEDPQYQDLLDQINSLKADFASQNNPQTSNIQRSSSGVPGAVVVMIIILLLCVFGIVALVVFNKAKSSKPKNNHEDELLLKEAADQQMRSKQAELAALKKRLDDVEKKNNEDDVSSSPKLTEA
jgi:hypothetical protein